MRATVWSGRNKVSVENVPDPKILNERDAIVKITSTAICGSDLHLYDGYIPTMRKGDILGHEFMGEVVENGRGVSNLEVGDRVVVPFPIACGACNACTRELFSLCENSNPNASMAEKLFGDSTAGIFGYSHLTGGYAGGQAEYARVPFADVGPIKIDSGLDDEQVLFFSDIFPTGWMGAEMCDIKPGDIIAVWGAGPGRAVRDRQRVPARRRARDRDRPLRLPPADGAEKAGAETINYEQCSGPRGAAGADRRARPGRLHRRGRHGGPSPPPAHVRLRPRQAGDAARAERGYALREAILNCRNGGTVSIAGVYGGFIDKFPIGAVMNRSLTIKNGPVPRAPLPAAAARADRERRHRPELRRHPPHVARRRAGGLRDVQEQAGRVREGRAEAVDGWRRCAVARRPLLVRRPVRARTEGRSPTGC